MKSCQPARYLSSRTGMRACDEMRRIVGLWLLMMVLMTGALAEPPRMVVRDFGEWSFDVEAPEDGYNGDRIYRHSGPSDQQRVLVTVFKGLLFYVAACLIVNHYSPDNKLVRFLFSSWLFDRSKRAKREEGDIYDLSQYDDGPDMDSDSFSESDDEWEEDSETDGFEMDDDDSLDFDVGFESDNDGDFDNDSE